MYMILSINFLGLVLIVTVFFILYNLEKFFTALSSI